MEERVPWTRAIERPTSLNLCFTLQTRAAVIMALGEMDRLQLVTQMDEHQVAELLPHLSSKHREAFIETLSSRDSVLATCAVEMMWWVACVYMQLNIIQQLWPCWPLVNTAGLACVRQARMAHDMIGVHPPNILWAIESRLDITFSNPHFMARLGNTPRTPT